MTFDEHQLLRAEGAKDARLWTSDAHALTPVVGRFKSEVKGHCFDAQSGRCCYCSFELQKHKATYDAEHVLDRSTFPGFAFEFENLAASCKPCNGHKGAKSALLPGVAALGATLPALGSYAILHPHHDEWGDHLVFDMAGRIHATSEKGEATISCCGIGHLNSARLAKFLSAWGKGAEDIRNSFFDEDRTDAWRRKLIAFLREVGSGPNLGYATQLADELESLMA